MFIEVESNENCETGFFGRFKEIRPARPVVQVKLYDRNPSGEWYWVTGWSDDDKSPLCQAHAQLVEDSGAGLTYLVYGGIYGLRFKPVSTDEPGASTGRTNGEKPTCPSPASATCATPRSSLFLANALQPRHATSP